MKSLWSAAKNLIWPRRCILCRRFLGPVEARVCPECLSRLPEPFSGSLRGSHYKRWAAAVWYEEPLREAFLRYKFGGCRFYAELFGPWLAEAARKQLDPGWELLTYVPISRLRLHKRGYDQTLLLARAAGRVLGAEPVRTLKKRNLVAPQSRTLNPQERQRNIRGAFRIIDPELVRGKGILLIDDLLTTGATVSEAARVLKEAGAGEIQVAVLAAAPKG
ncbi:MAG: ComF family protein [Oscillospiraceae bacterium]|nr:ComF family protein [Oscillospiraceae bacterium]